jgi:hypothetical protein
LSHEAEKGFVHQGGRLKGVVWAFVTQVGRRPPLELAIHQRQEIVTRAHIALCPRMEQAADGVRSFCHATPLPGPAGVLSFPYRDFPLKRQLEGVTPRL